MSSQFTGLSVAVHIRLGRPNCMGRRTPLQRVFRGDSNNSMGIEAVLFYTLLYAAIPENRFHKIGNVYQAASFRSGSTLPRATDSR